MNPAKTFTQESDMMRRIAILFWAGLCLLAVSITFYAPVAKGGDAPAKDAAPRVITSLRAFLYYHQTGEFSRYDILGEGLARGDLLLYNVEINPGTAGGYSSAMLVLVGVAPIPSVRGRRASTIVRLTVKAEKKIVFTHEELLFSFFSPAAQSQIPFLVYRTGCEPLEITAALVEEKKIVTTLSRTAEFQCHRGD
jgi:hypothetical protein